MLRILGSAFHRELAHDSLCSRASLPRYSQARPCFWQETLSVTARPPWNLSQVALEAQPGSSRAWPGSASCCRVFAEGKASLARSASLDACPLALPFCLWALVRASEAGNFLFFSIFPFLFPVWTVPLTLVLSCPQVQQVPVKFPRVCHFSPNVRVPMSSEDTPSRHDVPKCSSTVACLP